ncbi:MAG TPA: DUF5668 domain-containing protein [Clostridia bacterium]|nr:DUF5668 domain-containing protein [Clostridia bacterium]
MNRTSKTLGGIFVIIGILFLLNNFHILAFDIGFIMSRFWPAIFIILPGLMFHSGFFSGNRRNPGLLVPGGILLVTGITAQLSMLFPIGDILWPLYIFSVAFGLYELYYFGNRERGLLIPIGILTGLSALFFMSFSLGKVFSFSTRPFMLPIVLICIGLLVLRKGKSKKY